MYSNESFMTCFPSVKWGVTFCSLSPSWQFCTSKLLLFQMGGTWPCVGELQQGSLTRSLLGANRRGKISFICVFHAPGLVKPPSPRSSKGKCQHPTSPGCRSAEDTSCLYKEVGDFSAKAIPGHWRASTTSSASFLRFTGPGFFCLSFTTWWKRGFY